MTGAQYEWARDIVRKAQSVATSAIGYSPSGFLDSACGAGVSSCPTAIGVSGWTVPRCASGAPGATA